MFRSTAARVSVLFFLVAGLLGAAPVGSTPVAAADNWINTSDRDAVIQAYETEFANPDPASGWTGSRQSCTPGTTSQTFRDAIFSRVNYFRGMAGVPAGITENPTWSAHAQEAALMMSASSALSHSPTPWDGTTAGYNANIHGYKCYTAAGATAAGSSDLYLGRTGPRAITGYIEDPGANNTRVGHRNWIFHPTTTQMGTGDIPSSGGWSSNTLWVFDNVFGAQPALRENQGFVAWPPRGYVPGELVFPRWSISVRNGDFSNASITMRQDGSSVSNAVVHRDGATSGAPFPIIVWEPVGVNLNPSIDTTYEVTVSGAKVNGVSTTFSYNVVILGDTPAAGGQSPSQYNEFVSRSYQDFVGRAPNDSELTYWTQQLSNGLTRFAFVEALANSDAWIANVVNELYVNTLGRSADQPGREFWTANLQEGWSVAQVAASFYGSSEYVASKGGTYDAWVDDLYGVLLERNADGGGRAYWAEQASSVGSGTVAFRFYQSDESREARVIALYQKFLGRNPDAAGLAYWAEVLESGDDLRLAAFLASSDEYFAG